MWWRQRPSWRLAALGCEAAVAEGSAHLPSSVGSMTPCQRRGGFEKVLEKGISAHFTIKVEVTSAAPAPGRMGASDQTVSQRLQVTAVTHPVLGGS